MESHGAFLPEVGGSPPSPMCYSRTHELPAPGVASRRRGLLVVVHMFLALCVCAMDRVNLAVTIVPMGERHGWSETARGAILAALFVGYVLSGVAAGRLADRHGGRLVLAAGVAVWSAMTMLTPFAAERGLGAILVARALLGFGEGAAMPSMNAIVKQWVAEEYVTRGLAFIYSGMYAGSVVGLLLTPPLMVASGWEAVFYVFGLLGFAWVVLFLLTVPQAPGLGTGKRRSFVGRQVVGGGASSVNTDGFGDTDTSDSSSAPSLQESDSHVIPIANVSVVAVEKGASIPGKGEYRAVPGRDGNDNDDAEVPAEERSLAEDEELPTLRQMLCEPAVWAIFAAHFTSTWGFFILVVWLPSYLVAVFKTDITESALLSVAPWLTMLVTANASGALADWLLARGAPRTRVRKAMQTVAFAGPAVFLGLMMRARTLGAAVAYVTAGLGLSAFTHAGVYCNHQDIASKNVAGVLLGASNTVASLPGIFGVGLVGVVLDATDQRWNVVFAITIGVYVIGGVVYAALGSARKIF